MLICIDCAVHVYNQYIIYDASPNKNNRMLEVLCMVWDSAGEPESATMHIDSKWTQRQV